MFTGETVLASLARGWLISVGLSEKLQLLMIIAIYLNNNSWGRVWQAKGQDSAVKCCLCGSVFVDMLMNS